MEELEGNINPSVLLGELPINGEKEKWYVGVLRRLKSYLESIKNGLSISKCFDELNKLNRGRGFILASKEGVSLGDAGDEKIRLEGLDHRVLTNREGPRISVACFLTGVAMLAIVYTPIKELLSE
ncbi:hypothetical protein LguiB_008130 [Lonicera macranthoides]